MLNYSRSINHGATMSTPRFHVSSGYTSGLSDSGRCPVMTVYWLADECYRPHGPEYGTYADASAACARANAEDQARREELLRVLADIATPVSV
jgi:hypothetical protein